MQFFNQEVVKMFLFCRHSELLFIRFSLPICRTIYHKLAEVFPILVMLYALRTIINNVRRDLSWVYDISITECFAATSTFAQYRFGKFFKAQLWENVHNVINSTVRSDILVFNCYLCHVSFLLTCYVCSTKIGEISDISKCFENFVSQALGFPKRFYAAELRN